VGERTFKLDRSVGERGGEGRVRSLLPQLTRKPWHFTVERFLRSEKELAIKEGHKSVA